MSKKRPGWQEQPPPVSFSRFRVAVRQFRREGLLRQLGAVTAAQWHHMLGRADNQLGTPFPWTTSLIAREALLLPSASSATNRLTTPSVVDVEALAALAADLAPPPLDGAEAEQIVHDLAVRAVYQQWPYSADNIFGGQARIRPMFDRSFPPDRFDVLTADSLNDVLGGPLDVFIDSGVFFATAAAVNAGQFDEGWLAGPQFAEVRARVGLDELLSVFRTAWAGDLHDLRREAQKRGSRIETMRQYDWNPLQARPFVRMSAGDYLAPQSAWTQLHVSPTAIYHLGIARHGDAWARDLGKAQEDYILRQLEQLEPAATVVPEIEWESPYGSVRSVDAIVMFADCTVLVESKSLRARVDSTTNFAAYTERLSRDLIRVCGNQLPRTLAAIRTGDAAFAAVPHDGRPILALVVTPEPLYLANIPAHRRQLPDPGIPYAMVSLTELENLVAAALADGTGAIFQAAVAPRPDGSIDPNAALQARFRHDQPNNPLLTTAWKMSRWGCALTSG